MPTTEKPKVKYFLPKKKQKDFPNKEDGLPKNSICAICGVDRPLDRAHVIPKRYLEDIETLWKDKVLRKATLSYTGLNSLILCKNHHWLFDHFQLTHDEFAPIHKKVADLLILAGEIASRVVDFDNKGDEFHIRNKIMKWVNSFEIYVNNKTEENR